MGARSGEARDRATQFGQVSASGNRTGIPAIVRALPRGEQPTPGKVYQPSSLRLGVPRPKRSAPRSPVGP